jgi:hypothetical protein
MGKAPIGNWWTSVMALSGHLRRKGDVCSRAEAGAGSTPANVGS